MTAKHGGDTLERHDRVQGGHLDADHIRQLQDSVQRRVVVADPAGRFVQIEGYDRELAAEAAVVADRILPFGKGEQGIGLATPGLDGHADVPRPGDDDTIGHRIAPGVQHLAPYACAEMRTAAGMSPYSHPGNRLSSHPGCVRALGSAVHLRTTKWHRHGRDEAPI
jgi:hypothetical protein